jgi:hypothetical protein
MAGTKSLICPSTESAPFVFASEPCSGAACHWVVKNRCTAVAETADEFRRHYTPPTLALPTCDVANRCRWNIDAIINGDRACPPRSLGLLCEHQANATNATIAIWNTFDMADPDDDECWQPAPSKAPSGEHFT